MVDGANGRGARVVAAAALSQSGRYCKSSSNRAWREDHALSQQEEGWFDMVQRIERERPALTFWATDAARTHIAAE